MIGDNDTISAIATAKGVGALSIVRVSGSNVSSVLSKCFKTELLFESHKAYHGFWKDPESQEPIDEVLALYFAKGKGFTGEESVEVICHGGSEVTNRVLEACLSAGSRLARPGEFTYRAFMNGKIDLMQAEAVLSIIQAKSLRACSFALQNIKGVLSDKMKEIEGKLLYVLAHLEASIDFTTEDIQPVNNQEMASQSRAVQKIVENLVKGYSQVLYSGLRVVLVGQPNAGKSSLLNALVGRQRSIVDSQPGTTRDFIEDEVSINGFLVKLVDTAGVRESENAVEKEGVRRSLEEIKKADLIIYIVDATLGVQNQDSINLKSLSDRNVVLCYNKSDLKMVSAEQELRRFGLGEKSVVFSSAVSVEGVEAIREAIGNFAKKNNSGEESDVALTSARQKEELQKVSASLEQATDLLEADASPDLVSLSVKEALIGVQKVLGKSFDDSIMDRVFKEFCIGK